MLTVNTLRYDEFGRLSNNFQRTIYKGQIMVDMLVNKHDLQRRNLPNCLIILRNKFSISLKNYIES